MSRLSTTKLSSKGQIVIPEEIRSSMGLTTGDNFVIVAEKGVVILKPIKKPSVKEYENIIETAHLQAKQAGLKRTDIKQAIKEGRARNKKG